MEEKKEETGRKKKLLPVWIIAGVVLLVAAVLFAGKTLFSWGGSRAEVGDLVTLGTYEQDNDYENGKEPLEWIVLKKDGKKALLVTRYGINNAHFDASSTLLDPDERVVTWADCALRESLNSQEFMDSVFSPEEQAAILLTTITDEVNPETGTAPGEPSEDKVFLLSISEAERLFASDEDRKAIPTEYARENGVFMMNKKTVTVQSCLWWLRSPGNAANKAAYIGTNGIISYSGFIFNSERVALRPAVWVDLTKLR